MSGPPSEAAGPVVAQCQRRCPALTIPCGLRPLWAKNARAMSVARSQSSPSVTISRIPQRSLEQLSQVPGIRGMSRGGARVQRTPAIRGDLARELAPLAAAADEPSGVAEVDPGRRAASDEPVRAVLVHVRPDAVDHGLGVLRPHRSQIRGLRDIGKGVPAMLRAAHQDEEVRIAGSRSRSPPRAPARRSPAARGRRRARSGRWPPRRSSRRAGGGLACSMNGRWASSLRSLGVVAARCHRANAVHDLGHSRISSRRGRTPRRPLPASCP